MEKVKNYEETVKEVEEIVKRIENPDTPISEIVDDVKKAMELLAHCKKILREGEEEIDKLTIEHHDF